LGTTFFFAKLDEKDAKIVSYQKKEVSYAYARRLTESYYLGLEEKAFPEGTSKWLPVFFDADGHKISEYPGVNVYSTYGVDSEANNLFLLSPDKRYVVFFGFDLDSQYDLTREIDPGRRKGKARQDGIVSVYRIQYGDEVGANCVAIRTVVARKDASQRSKAIRSISTTEAMKVLSVGGKEKIDPIGGGECNWYKVSFADGDSGWLLGKDIEFSFGKTSQVETAKINSSNIRIRDAPSLQGKQIGLLPKETTVTILERTLDKQKIGGVEFAWQKVGLANGMVGWVYGQYVDILR